ncbi:hypothetical protein MRB53_022129 [Persea americana]|uniref:Uncharacterized protein n=1 Tax=Persea americana TaxID=3435 RepID=A0ACC2L6J9_PERAE|nr:hypothetical protein MRB53_022129 [Persea americana]
MVNHEIEIVMNFKVSEISIQARLIEKEIEQSIERPEKLPPPTYSPTSSGFTGGFSPSTAAPSILSGFSGHITALYELNTC